MVHYIKKLIEAGEHQRLDFKFEIDDSRKIAKSLVAFANTDGGTLLIGVKDNGKIAGIRSEEEIYMVDAAATMFCKPKIEFHIKKWQVDGKNVLEVMIPKSERPPHYAEIEKGKWIAYLRVKDENIVANTIMLKVWKKKKHSKGVLLEFTDKEKMLLDFLSNNPTISLSKYCRIALLTRKNAESILANLISLNLIEMKFQNKQFVYSLK